MSRLVSLGLTAATSDAFAEVLEQGTVDAAQLGRVARVDRGEVLVLTSEGPVRAVSDSQRAQDRLAPVTGDWVVVGDDAEVGLFVSHVFERSSAIVRRDPAENAHDQVLVANIDTAVVVHGLDQAANDARIERFLVLAIDSGADPVIVLNKADHPSASPAQFEALAAVAPVIATSATTGQGIPELRAAIGSGTAVFIGPSGVGKSTLVNALVGDEVAETGEVRERDRRGRHTTTVRELIEIPGGGAVIDTPGIRAIGLWAADIALDEVFADIADVAAGCKFGDCTHRQEPACAVLAAVAAGDIDATRLSRYHVLWQELAEQAIELERQKRKPRRRGRRR